MKLFITIFLIFNTEFVGSVEPDEILENPELEEIAKEIGRNLRCLVCQNEDIENSNVRYCKRFKNACKKKLTEGESKKKIISFVHSRYGDFVLFSPPFRYDTLGLWIFPLVFFIFLSYLFFKRQK